MKLSDLKNIAISLAISLFTMSLATQAYAFCFTNNLLSKENLLVRQLDEKNISALKKYEQCLIDAGYYKPFDAKPDPRPKWKSRCGDEANVAVTRFLGSSLFKKSVRPNKTQCCSWKTKDCNPSGKKNGKITFAVGSKFYVRKFGAQDIDWLVADENFQTFYEMKATDHMVCNTSPAAGTKKFKRSEKRQRFFTKIFHSLCAEMQNILFPTLSTVALQKGRPQHADPIDAQREMLGRFQQQ